jgi:hypothetical protein
MSDFQEGQIVVKYPYESDVIFESAGIVVLVREYCANWSPDAGAARAVQHHITSHNGDVFRIFTGKRQKAD